MNGGILLAGSTGLIGSLVAARLATDASIAGPVVTPVRRPPDQKHPKLVQVIDDMSGGAASGALTDAIEVASSGRVEVFVSCLGTTMKKAGSESAFVAVDRDLVLRLAAIARELGAKHSVLVSSVGADPDSGSFYLRVKGEVEQALVDLGFTRTDIMRPSLLLGARGESRPGERFAQVLAPVCNPLLLGSLRRYRSIRAGEVSAAIVELVRRGGAGRFVHEFDAIRELARAGTTAES